jgi:hypothetical protein
VGALCTLFEKLRFNGVSQLFRQHGSITQCCFFHSFEFGEESGCGVEGGEVGEEGNASPHGDVLEKEPEVCFFSGCECVHDIIVDVNKIEE